jgi:hypothetical protein
MPFCLELGPLVGRKHVANTEEHLGVCFFELSTSLGCVVDLGKNFVRIWRIRGEHRLHEDLLLLNVGSQVDQLKAALLQDVIHTLLLVRSEIQFLNQVRIMPPDPRRPDAEAGTHASSPSFTILIHLSGVLAGAHRRTTIGLLGDQEWPRESCKQN